MDKKPAISQCGALNRAAKYLAKRGISHNGSMVTMMVPKNQIELWRDLLAPGEFSGAGLWQVQFRALPSDHPAFGGSIPEDLDQHTFPVFVDVRTGACALFQRL